VKARIAAACALALVLAACGREQTATPANAPAARKLTTVNANYNTNMGYAVFYIGKKEGFFEQEGIDLQLVPIEAQSSLIALTTGKIDVLGTPIRSGLFNVMTRGVDVQIVADRGHLDPVKCQAEAFTAPPDTAARVEKKGFKGENFALIRGGNMEFQISQLLRQHGLTIADVNLMQLPQGGDYLTSQSKKLDAVRYMQEPNLSGALASGAVKVVARVDAASAGQPLAIVAYGKRLLRDDPELGRRFMRAYLRSVRRMNEGKTDRNVQLVSEGTKLPPEIVRRACWTSLADDGRIEPKSLDAFFAWAKANGHLDADVPAERWWNPSFVDAANSELAQKAAGSPGT
jgi:NitT/TauT family transport system substrate-binding protein